MPNSKYLYLMIKTHQITGLKYLCKRVTTSDTKAISYKGSGTRWNNHLKVHGKHINTEILARYELEKVEEFSKLCLEYSAKFNIVASDEWANLIEENGLMGAVIGENNSMKCMDSRNKMIATINSPEYKKIAKIRAVEINSRPEVKEKIRQSKLGDRNPSKRIEVKEKIKKSINNKEVISYLREINLGEKNPNADIKIYQIKNKLTGDIIKGNKWEISKQSELLSINNPNICKLTVTNINEFFRSTRKINSVKGWIKI